MIVRLTTFDGPALQGAGVLRERLRWAAADRRWRGPCRLPVPPLLLPPTGQEALRCGARLSAFLEVGVARTAKPTP